MFLLRQNMPHMRRAGGLLLGGRLRCPDRRLEVVFGGGARPMAFT